VTIVAALDIGGTHVSAGRVEVESGTVDDRARIPLAGNGLLPEIIGAAKGVTTANVAALGVAVPGPFDYEAGVSAITHKLAALYRVDLRRELAAATGLRPGAVVFLNDAAAFLLGEWWAGSARGHTRVIGITLGTGLGSAFLEDGRIVTGGGELYRLAFRGGPVEETISREAIRARYGADGLDVEQIAERARRGDARAQAVFEQFATDLAEFLDPTLRAFAADCLVVGGSMAGAWDLLGDCLRNRLCGIAVARAAHLEDAPLLGAALHAIERAA
jgi:glucokinase